jgi:hypothetical protein
MVLIEEFAPVYKMYIVTEDRRWLFSPYYSSIAEANNFLGRTSGTYYEKTLFTSNIFGFSK